MRDKNIHGYAYILILVSFLTARANVGHQNQFMDTNVLYLNYLI